MSLANTDSPTRFELLRTDTRRELLAGLVTLVLATLALGLLGLSGPVHISIAVLVYLGISSAIYAGLALHLPHVTFGPANRISLARGIIISLMAGLVLNMPSEALAGWVVFAMTITALILDGLDGAVARRTGMASPLGARLDGELDGLMTLVLCLLIYFSDRADAIVLLSGALHYVFLGASRLGMLPDVDLPQSFRRQCLGVCSVFLLVLCCVPLIGQSASIVLAGTSAALLLISFSIDFIFVLSNRKQRGTVK